MPGVAGVVVLNSTETGFPIAFMDATWLTGMRTVAVSLVSAQRLAVAAPTVLGIVGAGFQGRLHGAYFPQLFPSIRTIKVFEVYEPNLKKFVAELEQQCPGVKVEAVGTPDLAVRGCDIVVTATGKLSKPIFDLAWLGKGGLALPIHTQGWNAAAPSEADKLVCDDWAQFSEFAAAYTCPDSPHAETGQVIAGLKAGRENDDERILCFNTGLAIHDVAVASDILRRATAKGLGSTFVLQDAARDIPIPRF
jgi:ornithine cyclodeaminase/alanine dehydrogenase-like protein (mu-crystallin family)